jgi:hypothetical protein
VLASSSPDLPPALANARLRPVVFCCPTPQALGALLERVSTAEGALLPEGSGAACAQTVGCDMRYILPSLNHSSCEMYLHFFLTLLKRHLLSIQF